MTAARRLAAKGAAFTVLSALSTAYILAFDFWGLRAGLGVMRSATMALGYAMTFWVLVAGFVFYLRRLGFVARVVVGATAGVLALLLVLAWPGFYMSDSFAQISAGVIRPIDRGLGAFTPIITHALIQHIPTMAAVPAAQIAFFALALGAAVQLYVDRGEAGLPVGILLAWLAVSAPVLFTVLLVSRDTWMAIVSMFVVIEGVRLFADPHWRDGRTASRLLLWCVIAGWMRIDGVLMGLLVVAALLLRWRHWGRRDRAALIGFARRAVLPAAALFVGGTVLTTVLVPGTLNPSYAITLWINPVGYVIQRDRASIDPADLARIDAAVPLNGLEGDGPDAGIDAYWYADEDGTVRVPPRGPERTALAGSVARIVLAHPATFIENRWRVLMASNGPRPGGAVWANLAFIDAAFVRTTMQGWGFSSGYQPKLPEARRAVERAFFASTTGWLGRLQWAFLPEAALLGLLLLTGWRRMPDLAFGAAILLVRVPLMILLAPESQTKYYASLEFASPILLVLALARWLPRPSTSASSANPSDTSPPRVAVVPPALDDRRSGSTSLATLARFGLVSLIGWGGDFALFAALTAAGFDPLPANLVSAGAAVTFVYFASVRRIFRYRGDFLYAKWIAYLAYQGVAVLIASAAIATLAAASGHAPILAKLAITPFTFVANYLFMKLLTRPVESGLADTPLSLDRGDPA